MALVLGGGKTGGGSQEFVKVQLRTSLDFADPIGSVPVLASGGFNGGYHVTLTLPPSPFGNNGVVKVRVYNDGTDIVDVFGELIVCKADGLVYLAQDGLPEHVPAGGLLDVSFPNVNVSAGAGLSWSEANLQIDIASAGVFSAYVVLKAYLAP